MSTVGEKRFTTAGVQARKFDSTPPPAGDYDMKLDCSALSVARVPEPGKVPYINGLRIELLGTAAHEGAKNRSIYQNLWLSTVPDKGGGIPYEKADQLVGLARAFGEEYEGTFTTVSDGTENEDGTPHEVEIVEPQGLIRWLKAHDGAIIRGHTKVQKATKQWPAKGVVAYFIESESQVPSFSADQAYTAEGAVVPEEEENSFVPPPQKKRQAVVRR